MSLQTKTSKNKFELASNLLALNAAPEYLPCRENEVFRISSTLRRYIQDEKGLTMYIAGETGTGKTACVEDVIRQLSKEKNLHFEYLYINAMKLRTASDAYHNLYEKMMHIKNGSSNKPKKKKQKIQKKNESKYLSQLFSSNPTVNPRPFMVVVIDELDFLVTRGQQEIYEFFNWPQNPHSKLAVIGIANTVNLPEQLIPKIASRLEMTERISFAAYKFEQIVTILDERVKDLKVFDIKAIELCAKKVATYSGDIRRAFDVCRRALEMVEDRINAAKDTVSEEDIKVKVKDVQNAYNDLFSITENYPLAKLPFCHKLFLYCAAQEQKHSKKPEVRVENVIARVQTQLKKLNKPVYTYYVLMNIVYFLANMELVVIKDMLSDRSLWMTLDTETDSIYNSLASDADLKPIFEDA